MVADWHDGFLLGSTYLPGAGNGVLRLSLTNRTKAPIEGFRVGFSGQIRAMDDARISNGRIVTRLSGYHEIAPPAGFVLQPGATWETAIDGLAFPLRHWTDGPAAGFVIYGDGRAVPAVTTPPARENSPP
jgi:hexosaminidase